MVGSGPLGPFEAQSDPLSIKLGGYVRGAGHGATFTDNFNRYWHVSTTVLSVKNTFERRLGIWPTGFDEDGAMWCNTTFGDYPHYIPSGTIGVVMAKMDCLPTLPAGCCSITINLYRCLPH
ncbi:hypothetical protein KRR40_18240 [Niabella defluvii]|nr:hypothetical protein KRR40_18240 [Niabella sp. I65]